MKFSLNKSAKRNKVIVLGLFIACNINSCQSPVERNRDGARIYDQKCMSCHQEDGQGVGLLVPPLTDSTFLLRNRALIPCFIDKGLTDTITINGKVYTEKMPPVANLSDADLVNVLNYINQNWGNQLKIYTIEEVQELRANCK